MDSLSPELIEPIGADNGALEDASRPRGAGLNRALLTAARDALPERLNRGILLGDGGTCILGWMVIVAGMHPICLYGNTVTVADAHRGGDVIDVVGRLYGLERDQVLSLAEINDKTDSAQRVAAVRAGLDGILQGCV